MKESSPKEKIEYLTNQNKFAYLIDTFEGFNYEESRNSADILSKGISLNVNCSSKLFLNEIIPLAEKKASKDNIFFAKFLDPVKQCIKIFIFFF